MPLLRCEIKNEYGLGDPELYEESGTHDPEALLEGVAMAGLVGVLRQIGDLAEFAAGVFHGLHEQIVATSARGHRLMLCVQQLEVEFPAVEKAVLSQTTHPHPSNNAGIDWHPNNHLDQNLITQQDMPRFILNSYEDSRGPPQLFILDKFDVAGAGACLKRYSDPSLFKTNDSSSGIMESEIQREKKAHKTKKRGTRLMNTGTVNSFMKPDEKSIASTSEKIPNSLSLKRAKLKTRPVNSLTNGIGTSYMECILDNQIADQSDIHGKNSFNHFHSNTKSIEPAPEVHEIMIDASSRKQFSREIEQPQFIIKQNTTEEDTDGLGKQKGMNRIPESLLLPTDEVNKFPSVVGSATFKESHGDIAQSANDYCDANDGTEELSNNILHESEGMGLDEAGSGAGGIGDDVCNFDDDSELEKYVDALTALESEMETDSQGRAKRDPSFSNLESSGMSSNSSDGEQKQAKVTSSDLHSIQNSDGSFKERFSLDSEKLSGNFTNTRLTEENEDHTLECEKSLSFSSINLPENQRKISDKDRDTFLSLQGSAVFMPSELPENMEESTTVSPSVLPENMKENTMFMSSESPKIIKESTTVMPSESSGTTKESAAVMLSGTPTNINDNGMCSVKEPDVLSVISESCCASYGPQSGSEKVSKIYDGSGPLEIIDENLSASEDLNAMLSDQESGIESATKSLDQDNLPCTDDILEILPISEETVLVGDAGNPDVLSDAPPAQLNNNGLNPMVTYNLIHENELFSESTVDEPSQDAHTHSSTCPIPEGAAFKDLSTGRSQDSPFHLVEESRELMNRNLEIDDGIIKLPHFDGDSEDSRHETLNEHTDDVCGGIQNLQPEHFPTKENQVFNETKEGGDPSPHLLEVASDTFNDKERDDSTLITEIPVDSFMIENNASAFCSETSSNSIGDDNSNELNSISPSSQNTSGSEFKIQEESVVHDSTQELKNNQISSPYDNTLGLTSKETPALLCSKKENEETPAMLCSEEDNIRVQDHPFIVNMNDHDTVDSTDCSVALVPNHTQTDSLDNAELSLSHSDVNEVDIVLINPARSDGSFAVEFQSSTPEGLKEPDMQQPKIIKKMETAVCLDNSGTSSMNLSKEPLGAETEQITWVSANGSEKNDSHVSPCDARHQNHSKVEEPYNPVQPSSKLHVKSLENISRSDTQIKQLAQNGFQGSVADTQLPPLPPLQWRLGKLGVGSKMSFGATSDSTMTSDNDVRQSPTESLHNSSAPSLLLDNDRRPQVNCANSGSRRIVSVTDDDKQHRPQQTDNGDEKIQSLSLYVPSSTMQDGVHQHNLYMSGGEMFYGPYPVISAINPQQPNGKPRSSSFLHRPRNPLIEAVASHDRSTLRKVSEMNLPKVKSKPEEKDTLLEQIRKKSFNLKPASVTKPQVNGPSTNLKLVAILEKANAIRQACVGSDEDDDGNWSDS